MANKYDFIYVLLSAFLLFVSVSATGEIRAHNTQLRIIDGDTFEFKGEKIRIRGVDTPELRAKCQKERALALAAKSELERLLSSSFKIMASGKDKYGRTVADVYIQNKNIADILINSGHGKACLIKLPKARQEELLQLQKTAQNKRIGIWSKN